MIEHLDACAEALCDAGLPCTEYQMWVGDDDLVHYYFDYARHLTEPELMYQRQILDRFFKRES